MATNPPNLKIEIDNVPKLRAALTGLSKSTVMVGIPEEKTKRTDPGKMNNATLGYMHEHGSPVANIPARPFLNPGVRGSQDKWLPRLKQAAELAFEGKTEASNKALDAAGSIAASAVKTRITAGIPPPLAARTARARQRKHKKTRTGASALPAMFGGLTPLVDTSQMLNSITWVVRKSK